MAALMTWFHWHGVIVVQEACGRDSQRGRAQLPTTIYKADFVKVDQTVLYDLIKAASCPKGKDLLNQVYQRAANIIKR